MHVLLKLAQTFTTDLHDKVENVLKYLEVKMLNTERYLGKTYSQVVLEKDSALKVRLKKVLNVGVESDQRIAGIMSMRTPYVSALLDYYCLTDVGHLGNS